MIVGIMGRWGSMGEWGTGLYSGCRSGSWVSGGGY